MITFDAQRTLDGDGDIHLDFDHVYRIDARGMITDQPALTAAWDYAPIVEHDDDADILIDDRPRGEHPAWDALTGNSGQHGYTGAVMHPSEMWSQCHIDDLVRIADDDTIITLLFAIVAVEVAQCDAFITNGWCDCDNECPAEPAGWAVVYKAVRVPSE